MSTQMNIPFWDTRFSERENELLREVIASGYVNDGPVTTRFENAIAERVGCRHAVAVTSGTTALYVAMMALDIGPGDEVVVPDVTFIATANAVKMTGATPVLVDVDASTLNMSVDAARAAITERTRAIMPVHVSGRPADLASLQAIADEHGVELIEDAAEALLSFDNDRALGTIAKLGCYSFSPNKMITTGQGGIVVTNDDALHVRMRELKDQGRPMRGTGGADDHVSVGFNFKLTNLQSAVGLAQFEQLDARVETLRMLYRVYRDGLADVDAIRLIGFDLDAGHAPLWVDALVEGRDELFDYLVGRGIRCRKFWRPIHTQPPYRDADERFPVATDVVGRALWLPSAFTLTEADAVAVCKAICEFYE